MRFIRALALSCLAVLCVAGAGHPDDSQQVARLGSVGGQTELGNLGDAPKNLPGATSSSSADPYWANVKILLVNDSAANNSTTFTDQSTGAHTFTAQSGAKYSTASAPTGLTSSLVENGSSDYVKGTASADYVIGTGDFTFEGFFNTNTVTGGALHTIFDLDSVSGTGTDWMALHQQDTQLLLASNSAPQITAGSISAGTWYHWAVVRSGTTVTLYLGGSSIGSYTNNSSIGGAGRLMNIGAQPGSSRWFNGYLASYRLTIGTARYTTGFTPPTPPLPNS